MHKPRAFRGGRRFLLLLACAALVSAGCTNNTTNNNSGNCDAAGGGNSLNCSSVHSGASGRAATATGRTATATARAVTSASAQASESPRVPGPSASGGPISGDWQVTYAGPATVTITLAGGTYTEIAKTRVQIIPGVSCFLQPGTAIASFNETGPATYTGYAYLWSENTCVIDGTTPVTLGLSSDGNTLDASLAQAKGIPSALVFTRVQGYIPPAANGGPISGDWQVTYAAPATVTITLAGGTYTEIAKTRVQIIPGVSCVLQPGTVIATFTQKELGTYTGHASLWSENTCTTDATTSMTLALSRDGNTLVASLMQGKGIPPTLIFTRT